MVTDFSLMSDLHGGLAPAGILCIIGRGGGESGFRDISTLLSPEYVLDSPIEADSLASVGRSVLSPEGSDGLRPSASGHGAARGDVLAAARTTFARPLWVVGRGLESMRRAIGRS